MAALQPLNNFFNKYRDAILFNKNLIITGAAGFFSGALGAQIYSLYSNNILANAIVALLSEYAVDVPFFIFAHYIDNLDKYRDPITGRKKISLFKQDAKKIAIAISSSEAVYSVTKIVTHYQFLHSSIVPYEAAMASSLIGWAVFLILVNMIGKRINLFRKRN